MSTRRGGAEFNLCSSWATADCDPRDSTGINILTHFCNFRLRSANKSGVGCNVRSLCMHMEQEETITILRLECERQPLPNHTLSLAGGALVWLVQSESGLSLGPRQLLRRRVSVIRALHCERAFG